MEQNSLDVIAKSLSDGFQKKASDAGAPLSDATVEANRVFIKDVFSTSLTAVGEIVKDPKVKAMTMDEKLTLILDRLCGSKVLKELVERNPDVEVSRGIDLEKYITFPPPEESGGSSL